MRLLRINEGAVGVDRSRAGWRCGAGALVVGVDWLVASAALARIHQSGVGFDIAVVILSVMVAGILGVACLLARRNMALISRERRARRELQESEARYRTVFENTPAGISLSDLDGYIIVANAAYQKMLGYTEEEMRKLRFQDFTHPDDLQADLDAFQSCLDGERDSYEMVKRYIRKGGDTVWAKITVTMFRDPAGKPLYVIAMLEDITERKRSEDSAHHQALHDQLTGLPNRTLLHDRLNQALLATDRSGRALALLLMDLDRFKDVNDTFGHQYGDLLLRQLGARLKASLRDSDTIARLGGDEFAVLLPGTDENGAMVSATKLVEILDKPFVVEGQPLDIDASVGIALAPSHGDDATTLLQRADVAMYLAKRAGGGVAVYQFAQDQYSPQRLALMRDLRTALDADQLVLHYQPKVDFRSGRVDGVEALVRWQHPERGIIPPDEFIPLAEHTGLIRQLSLWVLDHALSQCRTWREHGLPMHVAVNLSARNLRDSNFATTIAKLLDRWDVDPRCLEVELTESAVMDDPFRAIEILNRLHDVGVRISIDDFGTGYSSLAYLKRLPVDQIKIDRSFVLDMARDNGDCSIVRATISLGHDLGLQAVAEGVEDQKVWEMLQQLGCDVAQGYYLCRPLPAEECTAWLEQWRVHYPQDGRYPARYTEDAG